MPSLFTIRRAGALALALLLGTAGFALADTAAVDGDLVAAGRERVEQVDAQRIDLAVRQREHDHPVVVALDEHVGAGRGGGGVSCVSHGADATGRVGPEPQPTDGSAGRRRAHAPECDPAVETVRPARRGARAAVLR